MKNIKYLLLGLFVCLFGFTCFTNAGSFTYTGHFEGTRNADKVLFSLPIPLNNTSFPTYYNTTINCNFSNFVGTNSLPIKVNMVYFSKYNFSLQDNNISSQDIVSNNSLQIKNGLNQNIIGLYFKNVDAISSSISFDYSCVFNGNEVISLSCPECQECETCPEVNTGDILSGSCDTNYCVENDLCPIASGSWSELKINDIVHEGRPFINISIPDYIHWDYTVDDNQYDVYVGSGYDQDYIDSVLKINSYRPDSGDFTNMFISGLTLIFPYIFLALLIVFIWKLLKRIFK